jgi:hypothetical protein
MLEPSEASFTLRAQMASARSGCAAPIVHAGESKLRAPSRAHAGARFVKLHQEHYWWPNSKVSGECVIFGYKFRLRADRWYGTTGGCKSSPAGC